MKRPGPTSPEPNYSPTPDGLVKTLTTIHARVHAPVSVMGVSDAFSDAALALPAAGPHSVLTGRARCGLRWGTRATAMFRGLRPLAAHLDTPEAGNGNPAHAHGKMPAEGVPPTPHKRFGRCHHVLPSAEERPGRHEHTQESKSTVTASLTGSDWQASA